MDIKIDGITREIMEGALSQAKEGRLYILAEMAKVIDKAREELLKILARRARKESGQ